MTFLSRYFLYCARSWSRSSFMASGHRTHTSRIALMLSTQNNGHNFHKTPVTRLTQRQSQSKHSAGHTLNTALVTRRTRIQSNERFQANILWEVSYHLKEPPRSALVPRVLHTSVTLAAAPLTTHSESLTHPTVMTSDELRSVTKLLAMVISIGCITSGGTST